MEINDVWARWPYPAESCLNCGVELPSFYCPGCHGWYCFECCLVIFPIRETLAQTLYEHDPERGKP